MNDLRTSCYNGRDIVRGETLLVSDSDNYDTRSRCLVVARHDISAQDIDKAQRIAQLNELHLVDMLERQSAVIVKQLPAELVCYPGGLRVDLDESEEIQKASATADDPALERFKDAYAACKATDGEDAEDPMEDRIARLKHIFDEILMDLG